MDFNGTKYGYVQNLQGDIIQIVDANGAVVVEYTYDAWGKVLNVTGSMADSLGEIQPFRYRGYVYDVETGLYYLRSRYYNYEIGRFINADKKILLNLYRYCKNLPVLLRDATGTSVLDEEEDYSFFDAPEGYSNSVTVNKTPVLDNASNVVVITNENAKLYDRNEEILDTIRTGTKLIATKTDLANVYSTYYGDQYGYIHRNDFEIDKVAENWEVEYGVTDWRRSEYKSEYVKRIQSAIGVEPDGIYGEKTEQRVIEVQRENGLKVDGIVGENTKRLLLRNYNEFQ